MYADTDRPIRFGLQLSQIEHLEGADQAMIPELARAAEATGVDDIFMGDRVAASSRADRDRHLNVTNERGFGMDWGQKPDKPWLDPITALAAVAAVTDRVRVIANGYIAPLRNHLASAKALATLDIVSRGRLVVTPVPSWLPDEYEAAGVDFGTRGTRLDDVLGAWHALWAASPAEYSGDTIAFGDMWQEPKPPAGPKLFFGGASLYPALVRRVVRYGSGLVPLFMMSDDDWATLDAALAEAGRERGELEIVSAALPVFHDDTSPADFDASLPLIDSMIGAGVRTFIVGAQVFCRGIDDVPDLCAHARKRFDALADKHSVPVTDYAS